MNWYFEEPRAFWLMLVPVALTLFFLAKKRQGNSKKFLRLAVPNSILAKEIRRSRWTFRALYLLTILSFLSIVTAIARPTQVETWTRKYSEGIDVMLVFDVSESMEATDLVPNRMTAAKQVINNFIRSRPNDRLGLVIFGGEAVTKCPLTRDHDFLLSMVEDSRMRELKQGTAIGMGLSAGISRLRTSESKTKVIVLITDGDSNVGAINPMTAANLAKQEGIKIYAVGIGKENRVVVPIYAYDLYGRKTQLIAQVPSYINPELLAQISRATGGKAYMARDTGMLHRILQEIDRLERTKIKMQPMQRKHEMFVLPALVGVGLLFLIYVLWETRFRRARPKTEAPKVALKTQLDRLNPVTV